MIPSLFFCADVQHAVDMAEVLRGHGHRVYPISGKTPENERRRLIEQLRTGEIDGLSSCEVLSVGLDVPAAMGCFMCRPTKSGLWYRQAIGRVLRPFPAPQGERQYQTEALAAIRTGYSKGIINQLLVMPTGTGKTKVLSQMPEMLHELKGDLAYRGRLLFLVHRDELALQAADSFSRANPSLHIGIEKADSRANGSDIVVASVQTLGRGKRLDTIRAETFDCVVQDEAHWAIHSKWHQKIYKHLRVAKGESERDPEVLLIGATATPNRADQVGLECNYDEIIYNYPLRKAIKDGWLADIHAFRAETTVDVSQVKVSGGDFQVSALSSTVNTRQRNELVAEKYLEISKDEGMEASISNIGTWYKPHAVIVDFADVCGKHSLIVAPTLLGLRPMFNAKGKSLLAQVEEIEALEQKQPGLDLRGQANLEAIHALLKSVDLLAVPEIPEEISRVSNFGWLRDGADGYHIGLMDHTMLSVRQDTLGRYEIFRHERGIRSRLWTAGDLKEAIRLAENFIPARDKPAMKVTAKWVGDPPTEPQATRLWQLDWKIRKQFHGTGEFYRFCRAQYAANNGAYSKGSLSRMIEQRMR